MILTINIGNTNLHWALFKENILYKKSFFCLLSHNNYLEYLRPIFKENDIEMIIICSVVPKITKKIKKALRLLSNKKTLIVGKDIEVPITNCYHPKKVGQDRLVNAFAATYYYGAPNLVIDLGTAITFNIVSKEKEFLGGMIIPGLEIALKSLRDNTALLPKTKLKKPTQFIGKNTKECILSGVVFGFSELINGLIKKIKKIMNEKKLKVIITGGDADFINSFLEEKHIVDKLLILKGLNLLSHHKQIIF